MTPLRCVFCHSQLVPFRVGGYRCLNGHTFLLTYNNDYTTTLASGTTIVFTPTFLTSNTTGQPKPARTPVPQAFYDAFEEDERRRQAQLDALADIANMEQEDGRYD